jgi:hypothetical protein
VAQSVDDGKEESETGQPRSVRGSILAIRGKLENGGRLRRHAGYGQLEVDAHDNPAEGRPTDLGEPGSGEDAAAADIELSPRDLVAGARDHRIALESTGATLPREVDGGARSHG